MLKTPGIPLWITIFGLVVILTSCGLGIMALAGQAPEPSMSVSWGGRSLGLGLVMAAAVFLKSPIAYMGAFLGGLARELGDLMEALAKPELSMGPIIGILVFLVLGVIGLWFANKAAKL